MMIRLLLKISLNTPDLKAHLILHFALFYCTALETDVQNKSSAFLLCSFSIVFFKDPLSKTDRFGSDLDDFIFINEINRSLQSKLTRGR
jgi:hypothetical protein